MDGIKVSVHPLFFVFGVYYALTGRIFVFVIYTACAVIHELGHSFVARGEGYFLNKISLMPFGAVVTGDLSDMTAKEQLKIAVAGPIINLFVGLFFVAVWWIFPLTYAYTDIVVEANLSLAIVNLLPVYPLDGGRILYATLSNSVSVKTAKRVCKITGILFAILLLGVFVATLFFTPNVSLLFFALFTFFGAIQKDGENTYLRLCAGVSDQRLKRGVRYNKIGVDESVTVKRLSRMLDSTAINEVVVYKNGEIRAVLSQKALKDLLMSREFNVSIKNLI